MSCVTGLWRQALSPFCYALCKGHLRSSAILEKYKCVVAKEGRRGFFTSLCARTAYRGPTYTRAATMGLGAVAHCRRGQSGEVAAERTWGRGCMLSSRAGHGVGVRRRPEMHVTRWVAVAEPPKCLDPPTPVIVPKTSDGDAEDPPTLEVR